MSQVPQNNEILQVMDFYLGVFTLSKSAMATKTVFPLMAAAIPAVTYASSRILKRKKQVTQGQGICNTICFKGQLYLVLRENSVLTSISEIPRW